MQLVNSFQTKVSIDHLMMQDAKGNIFSFYGTFYMNLISTSVSE